ncbi:MAG: MBL fold metallo-hydrolase [Bacteroidales bacterium]|nr:MBL fold metallo-hydrolase [Bacteroidales bacterium]
MKCIPVLAAFIVTVSLWLLPFCPVFGQEVASSDDVSPKIDSLIEIHKLNEQCSLINFGYDAITAINTSKGIVVIDAGISTGLTSRYRKIIENEFQGSNFACVINTHGHPDHVGGNSVFSESVIIGHSNCSEEIAGQWKNPEKVIKSLNSVVEGCEVKLKASEPGTQEWNENFTQKIRYLNAYNDARNMVPVRQPDSTFSDSLNLDMGNVRLEMFYFGKCHSTSDILIFLPGMKILFIGDLFFKYGRPSLNDNLMTDRDRWKKSAQWLENRMDHIEFIICGHGQMLSIDDLKDFNKNILRYCSSE